MQTATSQIFLDLLTLKLALKTKFFFVYIKTEEKKNSQGTIKSHNGS